MATSTEGLHQNRTGSSQEMTLHHRAVCEDGLGVCDAVKGNDLTLTLSLIPKGTVNPSVVEDEAACEEDNAVLVEEQWPLVLRLLPLQSCHSRNVLACSASYWLDSSCA